MSAWYYYDSNNQKQGPITGGQLKGLAKAGSITPETIVETENGKTATAGKVKGLTFIDTPQSQSVPPQIVPSESSSIVLPPSTAPNPFTAVPVPNTEKSSIAVEAKKSSSLKNSLIIAIISFVGGLFVMFVFDCIYCNTDSYKKRVAGAYMQKHLVQALADIPNVLAEAVQDETNEKPTVAVDPVPKPPWQPDPRLEKFIIENFRIREEDNRIAFEVSFNFHVQNDTGKAIKEFSADVEVKEPGRTVPLITKGFSHSPAGGIEPGERKSFSLSPNMFMGWSVLKSKNLNTLIISVTVNSITFHDGEIIRR
jgi:hypothetical protein